MNNRQIRLMILELVKQIDYDLYKEMLDDDSDWLPELVKIVEKHLKQGK